MDGLIKLLIIYLEFAFFIGFPFVITCKILKID